MKKQEILDKVATHLLSQMEQALSKGGSCMYRTEAGLKCAIGCLIPDDLYDPDIEDAPVSCFVRVRNAYQPEWRVARTIGRKLGIRSTHYRLLEDLQSLHDEYKPKDWQSGLTRIAEDHRLRLSI